MSSKHENLQKIGKIIVSTRKDLGISQEELAVRAGVGRTYMGRVERGEQNMSMQSLIKIAFALKTDPGSLLPKLSKLKRKR